MRFPIGRGKEDVVHSILVLPLSTIGHYILETTVDKLYLFASAEVIDVDSGCVCERMSKFVGQCRRTVPLIYETLMGSHQKLFVRMVTELCVDAAVTYAYSIYTGTAPI